MGVFIHYADALKRGLVRTNKIEAEFDQVDGVMLRIPCLRVDPVSRAAHLLDQCCDAGPKLEIEVCAAHGPHGCSTLSDFEQFEEWLQSCECGAVSVLSERFGSVCHEDVESEAAHAGEHGWV